MIKNLINKVKSNPKFYVDQLIICLFCLFVFTAGVTNALLQFKNN